MRSLYARRGNTLSSATKEIIAAPSLLWQQRRTHSYVLVLREGHAYDGNAVEVDYPVDNFIDGRERPVRLKKGGKSDTQVESAAVEMPSSSQLRLENHAPQGGAGRGHKVGVVQESLHRRHNVLDAVLV